MTRKERYEKSKREREKAKAREEKGGFNLPPLPPIEYLPLRRDHLEIFRVISDYWETAEDGTDGYRIKQSLIRGDKNKYFNVVWSFERDWPLNQLYYFMTKGPYDSATNTKSFDFAGCPILKKILTNDQDNKFATGWKPQELVLLNVIDRQDMEWHRENKKTKVLTKDASRTDDGNFYTAYGISSKGLYTKLSDSADENTVTICDTDMAIRRLSKKQGDAWYKVLLPEFDGHKIERYEEEDGVDYMKFATSDPTTDEELSWERVNFADDPRYQVTSMVKIYNNLKKTIKEIDEKYKDEIKKEVGTTFKELFEDQVEEDKKKFEAMKKEQEKKTTSVPGMEKKEEEAEEEPAEEPKPERKSRKRAVKEESSVEEFSVPEEYEEAYNALSDEEKSLIVGFNKERLEYTFPEDTETYSCPECKKFSPGDFGKCPYCGVEFDE